VTFLGNFSRSLPMISVRTRWVANNPVGSPPEVAFSALTLLAGWQEGHLAYKIWGNGGGEHCLIQMEWRPAGWSVCLPLLISPRTIKCRSSLLVPSHLAVPGKRAVKRLCCGGWWIATRAAHCLVDSMQLYHNLRHNKDE